MENRPIHGLNFYMSFFDDIAYLLPREHIAFIVGGWVRDRVLGKPVGKKVDIDILTTYEPDLLGKALAQKLNASYFEFEKKSFLIKRQKIATVILDLEPYYYRFDIAKLNAPPFDEEKVKKALKEDLLDRDFTINAMAVSLDDVLSLGAKQTFIYDPSGGLNDLEKGVLREVSLENIKKDPVRILRAYRFAAEFELEMSAPLKSFMRENKTLLLKSPKERLSAEIIKIFNNKNSHIAISMLYEDGLLELLIEPFKDQKLIQNQGKYHVYPLDKHSIKTLEEMENILYKNSYYSEKLSNIKEKIINLSFMGKELSMEGALKMAALFHDIGKPYTFKEENGKISFIGHDKLGADLIKEHLKKLSFGDDIISFLESLVLNHLRLFYLREALEKNELTDKAIIKLIRDVSKDLSHKERVYALTLLSVSDALSSKDPEEKLSFLFKVIDKLILELEKEIEEPIKPLLDGNEIMKILNITPSKEVGLIKEKLLEMQIEGLIKSKEEAIKYLKENFINN